MNIPFSFSSITSSSTSWVAVRSPGCVVTSTTVILHVNGLSRTSLGWKYFSPGPKNKMVGSAMLDG